MRVLVVFEKFIGPERHKREDTVNEKYEAAARIEIKHSAVNVRLEVSVALISFQVADFALAHTRHRNQDH